MLAEQVRSGLVETFHDGAVAIVEATGELVASAGEIDRPFFYRSAAKPFQAAVSQSCGAGLLRETLALACASHSGEPVHIALVRSILEGAGLSEDDLRCPPDWPLRAEAARRLARLGETAPRRIWNNCSGKHAAMLAACVASGWDPFGYLNPAHPLQVRIIDFMNQMSGPVEPLGVDGCGAPVFRTTVRGMARAFGQLAMSPDLSHVWTAMHAYPRLASGPGRSDATIATAVNAAAKGGARGTMGIAIRGRLGIAVKCWDGSDVVAGIAAVESLLQLGELSPHAERVLERFAHPVIHGGGSVAGSFESRLELRWW